MFGPVKEAKVQARHCQQPRNRRIQGFARVRLTSECQQQDFIGPIKMISASQTMNVHLDTVVALSRRHKCRMRRIPSIIAPGFIDLILKRPKKNNASRWIFVRAAAYGDDMGFCGRFSRPKPK